jgi:hypothetical protein
MKRRLKGASATAGDTGDSPVAVNVRVRVYPGTDREVGGTVVEDFGDLAGHAVDIGENHIVGPARRWAVALDAGSLVFVDSDQWPPSSFSCRGLPPSGDHLFQVRRPFPGAAALSDNRGQPACRTPDRTLINAPTARSHQAVCRCPLIRVPDAAIGVRRLRAAAQAARGALRGPYCVRLSGWWSLLAVWR